MTNIAEATSTVNATSLATAINEHCRQFEASEEFRDMIHKHVRALYEKTIEDTFRWGKFPDAVKKALEEALPGNITEIADLPRYNLLLARALDEQWKTNAVSERLVTQMQKLVKDFIEQDQVPKFIKASDLWAAYIEQYQEEAAHEGWGRPQVVVNDDRDGFFYIGLEKEPASESSHSFLRKEQKERAYECEVYLGFSRVTNRVDHKDIPVTEDGHPVCRLFTGKLELGDVLGKMPVSFHSKFEKLVGALYYGDSLLVLDDEADDIYYPNDY
ncbi:hypothetical protein LHK94_20685 [Dickeya zeae]|uniref:hypothetical protein n=1 Tax=Dickeya zeae TaxID=204042 RepID=UPI001CFAD377|nr:hypothetical protein [Dickeya zeae]UCZ75370.1 hypothetical protein LHK94_20685 [Dickeya zeae]